MRRIIACLMTGSLLACSSSPDAQTEPRDTSQNDELRLPTDTAVPDTMALPDTIMARDTARATDVR